MSTETQKLDVLAVMSDAAYYCLFECGNGDGHDALQEARAAVADLIEAASYVSRNCTDYHWMVFHDALDRVRGGATCDR